MILAAILCGLVILEYSKMGLSLWNDELSTYCRSTVGNPAEIVSFAADADNHPPGVYVLLSLWIGAFGDDPVVLRLPSLISQSLAILMIYAVTARLAGGEVGILASVLLAFSPHAIELGRMLRSYSPLILLSLILLWLTLDLVSTRRRGGGQHCCSQPLLSSLSTPTTSEPLSHSWPAPTSSIAVSGKGEGHCFSQVRFQ